MDRDRPARIGASVLTLASFAWYAIYSLQRQKLHRSGLDLAIFEQAVHRLAHFDAPISHIKGNDFNLFGDHFHPIIVAAVPFHWIHPHAASLLIAQAAALALAVSIVTRFAQRQLGGWPGLGVGFAFALAWGLQSALAFDFHEVSLGVPLMAAAAAAYVEERWRTAYVCTALLLLVKEDMALTVAAFGVYLCLQRKVRAGLLMTGGAVAWAALTVWVIIPALSPTGSYQYISNDDVMPSPIRPDTGSVDFSALLSHGEQWHTLLLLMLPMLFLPLLSPLSIVLLPTLAWRFASGNDYYWGTRFHYSEILMPLVFVAGVDGLMRLTGWLRSRRRVDPQHAYAAVAAGAVVVALALVPSFAFWQATDRSFWQRCPRCAAADAAVAAIPPHARVAADTLLMPELVDRDDVFLISPDLRDTLGEPLDVDYVLLDETHRTLWPDPAWIERLQRELAERGFRAAFRLDGYVVYGR